jgi:hypothetical protein
MLWNEVAAISQVLHSDLQVNTCTTGLKLRCMVVCLICVYMLRDEVAASSQVLHSHLQRRMHNRCNSNKAWFWIPCVCTCCGMRWPPARRYSTVTCMHIHTNPM